MRTDLSQRPSTESPGRDDHVQPSQGSGPAPDDALIPRSAFDGPTPEDVQPAAFVNLNRSLTGLITAGPIVALGVVGWQLWDGLLNGSDLIVLAIMYLLTGLGVTVGLHRLFTHRSFKTYPALRFVFAVLGSAAIEGPVISWVADHRKHHAFSDREGDPHSPHVEHGAGMRGILRGLVHAHVGWLFIHTARGHRERYAPDLIADPVVSFVDRTFFVWAIGGLLASFGLGYAIGGTLTAAPHRPAVGRRRADVPAAPRHLLDQLALPLLRPACPTRRAITRATSPGSRLLLAG